MPIQTISTNNAPAAIGPYSQAIQAGDFIFCSGQIGLTSEGVMAGESIEEQTHQVIQNLSAVLSSAGSSLEKVVKTTLYLSNMSDFAKVNEIYAGYFIQKPARATVEVKSLPKGALLEIECIAIR